MSNAFRLLFYCALWYGTKIAAVFPSTNENSKQNHEFSRLWRRKRLFASNSYWLVPWDWPGWLVLLVFTKLKWILSSCLMWIMFRLLLDRSEWRLHQRRRVCVLWLWEQEGLCPAKEGKCTLACFSVVSFSLFVFRNKFLVSLPPGGQRGSLAQEL